MAKTPCQYLNRTHPRRKKDHLLRLQGSDFASNDLLQNISNAKVQKVNEDTRIQYRYSAFYGRFNYDYSGNISSTLQQGEMVRVDLERTIDLPISEL
jgi:hypothetical protein